jgi:hypothetical protein
MVGCKSHYACCGCGCLVMTDAVAGRKCHCEQAKRLSNPCEDLVSIRHTKLLTRLRVVVNLVRGGRDVLS